MMAKRFFASIVFLSLSVLFLAAQEQKFYEISIYHKLKSGVLDYKNLTPDTLIQLPFFYRTTFKYAGSDGLTAESISDRVKKELIYKHGTAIAPEYLDLKPLGFEVPSANTSKRIDDIYKAAVIYVPLVENPSGGILFNIKLGDEADYTNRELPFDHFVHGTKDVQCFASCKHEGSLVKYTLIVASHTLITRPVPPKPHKGDSIEPPADFGRYQRFSINLKLPGGTHEEDTRVSVFPLIVDCLTEDTVAYYPSFVYDGTVYKKLQDKRKRFDYNKYDFLAGSRTYYGYNEIRDTTVQTSFKKIPKHVHLGLKKPIFVMDANGEPAEDSEGNALVDSVDVQVKKINVNVRDSVYTIYDTGFKQYVDSLKHDTLIIENKFDILINNSFLYLKPNKDRTYRCILRYTMEDYHHVYDYGEDMGTCLVVKPLKFLQLSNNSVSIKLDKNRFYEEPKAQEVDLIRPSLGIQFKHGTPIIIEDSAYFATLGEIRNDIVNIRESSGELTNAELNAYASPDGKDAGNIILAQKRADAAKGRLSSLRFPVSIKSKAHIDTWDHTAVMLDSLGYPQEAQVLRDLIPKYSDNYSIGNALKNKLGATLYNSVVFPVLQMQCRISLTYKYKVEKQLSPAEALIKYKENKKHLFNPGDYYNLFEAITDSAERDTLVEIAYNRLILQQNNLSSLLAPYVINEMACLKIRRMQPDTLILKQALNEDRIYNMPFDQGDGLALLNLPEVVLNQAIMYYMEDEFGKAEYLLSMIKKYCRDNDFTSGVAFQSLQSYVTFKNKVQAGKLDMNDSETKAAVDYIREASPVNNAVLSLEFPQLGLSSDAGAEIYKLSDDEPLKWYLMGLLWADRDRNWNQAQFRRLSDLITDKVDGVQLSSIPFYLAYFQKSFDLDKSYMKHYFQEGHVTEEMRKRPAHAYKTSRIQGYRDIFEIMKEEDDNQYKNKN
jgi:hypothetical protein